MDVGMRRKKKKRKTRGEEGRVDENKKFKSRRFSFPLHKYQGRRLIFLRFN